MTDNINDQPAQASREVRAKIARAEGVVNAMWDAMTDVDREGMRTNMEDMYDERGLPK